MHFPHSRMHQPFWPYSSASCRLSCCLRHAGIPAGAFHVCRLPAVPSQCPVRDLVPRSHRPPTSGAIPVCQTQPEPGVPVSCPFPWSRLWPRRSLPRRAPAGMPLDHRIVLTIPKPAQPKSQKPSPECRKASGASVAGLMILRSGAAPSGSKQPPLPSETVFPMIV